MKDQKPVKPRTQTQKNVTNEAKFVLERDVQARIGKLLRTMYDDVVQQGVPERFANLLRQLDHPDKVPKE
jgi:uncharacterized protein YpiB (UPF0302 family)